MEEEEEAGGGEGKNRRLKEEREDLKGVIERRNDNCVLGGKERKRNGQKDKNKVQRKGEEE